MTSGFMKSGQKFTGTVSPYTATVKPGTDPVPTGFFTIEAIRVEVVEHGDYQVVLALNPDGRFVAVLEVRVKQDFRTSAQRIAASGYLDVDEFYRD